MLRGGRDPAAGEKPVAATLAAMDAGVAGLTGPRWALQGLAGQRPDAEVAERFLGADARRVFAL